MVKHARYPQIRFIIIIIIIITIQSSGTVTIITEIKSKTDKRA